MMLRLPQRMEEVLLAVYGRGLREVDVARELGVSRQAINKLVREGRARLTETFIELAEVLQADIVRINLARGYAIIKLRQIGVKAYVFYIPGKGPRIVFDGEISCSNETRALCHDLIKAFESWGLLRSCSGDEESVIECVIRRLEE